MISSQENEEKQFTELRQKVRGSELLSGPVQHLLWAIRFTGRLIVVIQNGRVLKSGYEEGYFRSRPDTTSAEG
jgi:hypothetical protein